MSTDNVPQLYLHIAKVFVLLSLQYLACYFLYGRFSTFLAEPSFVFADVIREGADKGGGEGDKIYYFFTEVSVEYEFFSKLLIPRVARVCKVSVHHIPAVFIFKPLVSYFIYMPLST